MKNSKLIGILKTLETKELTRFREYVHSPFFNKHKIVNKLCDYILKFAPKFDSEKLNKKNIYKVLFPNTIYNETHIYTHTSNLTLLLVDYLAVTGFQKNPLQMKLYALKALRNKGLSKQFHQTAKQYQNLLDKRRLKDRDYHFYQAELYHEFDQINPIRNQDQNIQLRDTESEIVFLIDKMQIACDMINRNSIIGSNYEASGIDFVLEWLETDQSYYLNFPELRINYTIYKLIKTEEKQYYDDLRLFLADKTHWYSKSKIKVIYDYLTNHCIKKMNTGDKEYLREFFELHRFLLSEKILLLEDNSLDEWDYKNIVTVGARLEEFDWVKSFIYKYKNFVKSSSRENVFNYNLAYYYYSKKNYSKALGLLHHVEFTDASYYIGAKIIQLKCYYTLGELEASLSLIATFKNYIQRSKVLSDYKKAMNQNMLRMAKKIIVLESKKIALSKKELDQQKTKLQDQIKNLSPIANADWLVDILS
ncbi:hypothetical protein [Aureispira anguillae]|uniref:Uncharacterized protein n=1 Tax=Aureispira anguillae TaxID=2864201 RepID=A0A915YDR9_9BACT|nr:hypothetical protein [Aureispira anguillae]BDS11161.1 hypothetical protein AsAng_0018720 [Aureispira anguillae]